MYFPHVIETTGRSQKAFDLPTKLLQDRVIYLGGPIDNTLADFIIMQLLWLNADNPDKDIDMYINSPGGSVYAGLGIKDIMHTIGPKVNTVGVGMCASMGAYLLASGTGIRKATDNCRIMIHSVSSGTGGTVHDMEIDMKETTYLQKKMISDISEFTKGKSSPSVLKRKMQRDCYLDPVESIKLGLIDCKV